MAYTVTNVNPRRFHRSQIKIYAYLVPLALFMLLPLIFIFNHAFKPLEELFAFPPRFFVQQPTLENFSKLAGATASSDIHIGVVALTILFSTMGGYALSKMRFKGKKLLLEINNLALMFVATAVAIPRFLVIQAVGIQNTYLAHILPLLAMPVGLFLVKQFIDQIPDSLIEAATMDGASEFTVYRRVVMPLIAPAVATAGILAFQMVWNNTETSTMFIDSESMKTLAFYMNTLTNNANAVAGQGIAAAASLIMFLPNIVLFILLQSRVMNTMAQSGIK